MLNSVRIPVFARVESVSARILFCNKIRQDIEAELAGQIRELKSEGIIPGLAAVLVGENPASQIYVRNKVKTCEQLGIYSEKIERPADITTESLLRLIQEL